MNQSKIGEFIAKCRKEHNMTQMQFAEKLGVTNKAVSKWETGKCLPDAALFDDICILLNITLNEFFAGEKISSENIEKKAEENLLEIATELQKKDHKIVFLKYFTVIIALIASATSISVGGISFEGTPVFSNLLLTILVICSWGVLMFFTQNDKFTQKVALIINIALGGLSLIAFVLSFWDINSQVVLWIGFPCEILFYGFKLFWDWICIYAVVIVLAIVGFVYSKKIFQYKVKNKKEKTAMYITLFIVVLIVGLLMVFLPSKVIKKLVNLNWILIALRALGVILCIASGVTIYALAVGKIVLPLIK